MKNFLYISIFLLALLTGILVALPYFYNLNSYKDNFAAFLTERIGVETSIEGNISITTLPLPSIAINDVSIANVKRAQDGRSVFIQSVVIDLSFMDLLQGNLVPSKLELLSPSISYEIFQDGSSNIDELFKANQLSSELQKYNISDSLYIHNGFLKVVTTKSTVSVDYISAQLSYDTADKSYSLNGKFRKNDHVVSVDAALDVGTEQGKFILSAQTDDIFKTTFTADYAPSSNSLSKGVLEGKVAMLQPFLEIFSENSYGITSSEEAAFKGEFSYNKKGLRFENIRFDSENISADAKVTATKLGSKGNSYFSWEQEVHVASINIDNLTKIQDEKDGEEDIAYYYQAPNYNPLAQFDFDIGAHLSSLFSLNIDKLTYKKNTVSDVKVDLDIFNRKLIINRLSARLPGDSMVDVIGDIEHNGIRPHFKGRVSVNGDRFRSLLTWIYPQLDFIPANKMGQYVISANVSLTPQNLLIEKLEASTDKILLSGKIDADLAGELPVYDADISLSKFNLDTYGFTAQGGAFFNALFKDTDQKTVEEFWYDSIKYKASLKFSAKDVIYNTQNVKSFSFSSYAQSGVLNVSSFDFSSDKSLFKGSLFINLKSKTPTLKYTFVSPRLDMNSILPDASKASKKKQKSKIVWSRDKFNFLGLKNFSGYLNINIRTLLYGSERFSNVLFKGILDKQVLTVEKGQIGWSKSNLMKFSGKVGIGVNNSILLNFGLSKIPLASLASLFEFESKVSSGNIYATGNFFSQGKYAAEVVKNAKLNTKFTLTDLVINNFDMESIIRKVPAMASVVDMQSYIKDRSKNGRTLLNRVKGNLTSDKGIARITNAQIKTPYTTGSYAGNIDLMTFNHKSIAYMTVNLRSSKKPLRITYKLDGKINQPNVVSDYTQLENYITSRSNR